MNARVYSCHDNKTPSISSMREGAREKALYITIVLIQSPSLSHYNFTVYNAETQIEWNMYVWVCVCLWIQFVLFLFWFWCEVEPLSNTLDWPHEDVRIFMTFFCRSSQSIDRTISPRIQCKTMQFIFTIAYVFFVVFNSWWSKRTNKSTKERTIAQHLFEFVNIFVLIHFVRFTIYK